MTEYIEREKVFDVICNMHVGGRAAVENALPNTYAADLQEIIEEVDNIPAADVRPVVRGEWVKNSDRVGWHCSCCKVDNYYAYSWNSDTGKNEFQDKYCPNCGADMREVDDENKA